MLRCPSSTAPDHLTAQGITDRVPCNGLTQFLDHWYVGTIERRFNEISESMSSTGVAINSFLRAVFVDEKDLAFSSHHPGGAQVVLADGAVVFISETIHRNTWNSLGTRAGSEGVAAR